jgi:hypothetical protein
MQRTFASVLIAACAVLAGAIAPFHVNAQAEASALSAISAMPLASVVGATSAVAGAVVAVPVALSVGGAVLVVKAVQTSVKGTVYLLERASDAAPVSVEVAGKVASGVAVSVGTAVQVSVISAGTVLSVAGKAIAFIPNEVGKALLHNQRLTQ